MAELPTAPMTEEVKIQLVKQAISTTEGWKALAQSLISAADPVASKAYCIELLRKIAGNKEIDLPTNEGIVKGNFADLLIQQLEYNIALVETLKTQE